MASLRVAGAYGHGQWKVGQPEYLALDVLLNDGRALLAGVRRRRSPKELRSERTPVKQVGAVP